MGRTIKREKKPTKTLGFRLLPHVEAIRQQMMDEKCRKFEPWFNKVLVAKLKRIGIKCNADGTFEKPFGDKTERLRTKVQRAGVIISNVRVPKWVHEAIDYAWSHSEHANINAMLAEWLVEELRLEGYKIETKKKVAA